MTHYQGEILIVWLLISMALAQSDPIDVTRRKIVAAQFECYMKMMRDEPDSREGSYCKRTWDGWLCWEDSPAASISVQHCPDYYHAFNANEEVTKICDENGRWFRHPISDRIWSNYTQCSTSDRHYQKIWNLYYIVIIGNSLSIISLLVALGIFFHCRSLSCQRISLHKNLFLSYTLCAGVNLGRLSSIVSYEDLQYSNSVECKVMQFLHLYVIGCNYFWMLCEGIYLHTLIIMSVFVEEQKLVWYYILGWGFPLIPAIIYSIARSLYFNESCWLNVETPLIYVTHGPIYAAMVVNLFFLLNIVHVLFTKLKVTYQVQSKSYMKAVRATLILVPLLGIQFVLLPLKPLGPLSSEIFEYIIIICEHYQGFLVAMIFCFFNGEVQRALQRQWIQYKVQCGLNTELSHSNFNTASEIPRLMLPHLDNKRKSDRDLAETYTASNGGESTELEEQLSNNAQTHKSCLRISAGEKI